MLNFLRKQMKWVMAIIVVAFLLSTFLMYEGRGTRRTPGRNPDGSMSDYEVAQINGRSLMRSELERRLSEYLSTYSTRSAASLDMSAIYQAVLDQTVLEAQLAKEVEEKGIRVSDADADRAMKDYADRYYPTRETFYQALANSGVKIDDYKRSLARQMATEQLLRNAIGEVVISEDQAVEFYETMKNLIYSSPEGYMLHMADFRTESDAEFLRAKLEAGEKWADIVSNDELASHDVVNITREPVFLPSTAFSTGTLSVLASLDVGKASPVFSVASEDFAVGLKAEHVAASVSPYAEVSADIKTLLAGQEERRRLTEYQNTLLKSAQLVINDQELFARPVVSEEKAPAVADVIPELAEVETVSADTETPKPEEAKPAETPAVVEEEPKPAETPAVVEEEPKAEPEAPKAEETQPVETPAVVEEAKPELETPAVVEEAKPETETPAVVEEEAKPEETPAVVEEEAQPAETQPEVETIAESQDMPIQEKVLELMGEALSAAVETSTDIKQ